MNPIKREWLCISAALLCPLLFLAGPAAAADTSQSGLIVVGVVPVAQFDAFYAFSTVPTKVTFVDNSPGSAPMSREWDFGDGTTSDEQNPEHTYRDAGWYTVSLTVWNSAGSNKITKTNLVYVKSKLKPPKADFTAAAVSGKVPLKVAFTDASSGIITWRKWDFGDRTYSSSSNPVHTYKASGKYLVSLTVGNPAGSHTVKKYVSVTLRRH
jgi:PKD repeat protein